ncbi:hypothetical protein BD410DRAFT_712707 [Rickenella mellea]|uniref:F-box domain-containing protein n=1 Tax=Rickenella mellea TaxID=50990 RepID=A0A4Y7QL51_9AGAM|nr:hypothetical protein BD410DRAFT_712707 [Rickenella mellea]
MEFNDLPQELLPLIIQQIVKPQHLAWSCPVSKMFYRYAVPRLYERAAIFAWYKEGKIREAPWTLANCPHLARHVRRLELRDFPKALTSTEHDGLISTCLQGIQNCHNLRTCTWTRDGSLSTPILDHLHQHCPNLQELEFNGHHNGNYDPRMLVNFIGLRRISVIMPSSEVVGVFPVWMDRTGETLRSLTLICRASPLITDVVLESIAPSLTRLEQIHIAGCPKATHRGIYALISKNIVGITSLGLEGLSQVFGMTEFVHSCQHTTSLTRLRSITLTTPLTGVTSDWLTSISRLLHDSPLQIFRLYTSGGQLTSRAEHIDHQFVEELCRRHGGTLVQFGVLRLRVRLGTLKMLVERCARLEQLFVCVEKDDLPLFASTVSPAKNLRSIHITYRPSSSITTDERPTLNREELLAIVKDCPSTVMQFGVQTRVWQVERIPVLREDGSGIDMMVHLGPYESADVPEVFLVVRT